MTSAAVFSMFARLALFSACNILPADEELKQVFTKKYRVAVRVKMFFSVSAFPPSVGAKA